MTEEQKSKGIHTQVVVAGKKSYTWGMLRTVYTHSNKGGAIVVTSSSSSSSKTGIGNKVL